MAQRARRRLEARGGGVSSARRHDGTAPVSTEANGAKLHGQPACRAGLGNAFKRGQVVPQWGLDGESTARRSSYAAWRASSELMPN